MIIIPRHRTKMGIRFNSGTKRLNKQSEAPALDGRARKAIGNFGERRGLQEMPMEILVRGEATSACVKNQRIADWR